MIRYHRNKSLLQSKLKSMLRISHKTIWKLCLVLARDGLVHYHHVDNNPVYASIYIMNTRFLRSFTPSRMTCFSYIARSMCTCICILSFELVNNRKNLYLVLIWKDALIPN